MPAPRLGQVSFGVEFAVNLDFVDCLVSVLGAPLRPIAGHEDILHVFSRVQRSRVQVTGRRELSGNIPRAIASRSRIMRTASQSAAPSGLDDTGSLFHNTIGANEWPCPLLVLFGQGCLLCIHVVLSITHYTTYACRPFSNDSQISVVFSFLYVVGYLLQPLGPAMHHPFLFYLLDVGVSDLPCRC